MPAGISRQGVVKGFGRLSFVDYVSDDHPAGALFELVHGNYTSYPAPELPMPRPPNRLWHEGISPSGFAFSHYHDETTGERAIIYGNNRWDSASLDLRGFSNEDHALSTAWEGNPYSLKTHISTRFSDRVVYLPFGAHAINSDEDLIGSLWHFRDPKPSGYAWADGEVVTMASLLPALHGEQLRWAVPTWLSDSAFRTDYPVDARPMLGFTAESLEGDGDGEWVEREFFWQKTGGTEENRVYMVRQREGESFTFAQAFQRATPIHAGTNANHRPVIREACEVRARSGRISYGFDPMMEGDHSPTHAVNDDEEPRWWASVVKSGPNSINEALEVAFVSVSDPRNYELAVLPQFADDLEVEPTGPLPGPVVPIRLRGKIDPDTINSPVSTRVVIRNIAKPHHVLFTLDVVVLPEARVDLAIYRAIGPEIDGERSMPLPPDLPTNEEIRDELNRIFKQAGITFVLSPHSKSVEVDYDLNRDGRLDSSEPQNSEMRRLFGNPALSQAKLNLVILKGPLKRQITKGEALGWCPLDSNGRMLGNQVFALTSFFQASGDAANDWRLFHLTCAHEIGHALDLGTRNSYSPIYRRKMEANLKHDFGVFPGPLGSPRHMQGNFMESGLMAPGVKYGCDWMRHEDWFEGNAVARVKYRLN